MPTTISFRVEGVPQPRGSKLPSLIPKRGGGWVKKGGRPIVVARDDNKKSKPWMGVVAAAAREAYQGELLHGPIRLKVAFFFPRIKGHYGSGKNASKLKASAPVRHTQKPDVDKLCRALLDSLTGVIWGDDRQICELYAAKYYDEQGGSAEVEIEEIEAGYYPVTHVVIPLPSPILEEQ